MSEAICIIVGGIIGIFSMWLVMRKRAITLDSVIEWLMGLPDIVQDHACGMIIRKVYRGSRHIHNNPAKHLVAPMCPTVESMVPKGTYSKVGE